MILTKGMHVDFLGNVLRFSITPLMNDGHAQKLIIEKTAPDMLQLTAEFPADGKEPVTRIANIPLTYLFDSLVQRTTHNMNLTNTGLSAIKKNHKLITFIFWAGNIVTIEYKALIEAVSFLYQATAIHSTDGIYVLYVDTDNDGTDVILTTFFGQDYESMRETHMSSVILAGLLSLSDFDGTDITGFDLNIDRVVVDDQTISFRFYEPYKNRAVITVSKEQLLKAITR